VPPHLQGTARSGASGKVGTFHAELISPPKIVARLSVASVTGMDISGDAARAVVLTYGDAYEYTRRPEQTWAQAFQQRPRRVRLPARRQGEAVCYGRRGQALFVTSEQRPAPLWVVPLSE